MKFSTVKRSITLWIIFLFILISAYLAGVEQVAMRRESDRPIPVQGVVILSLDQALNESMAAGDYRRVNVNWDEVSNV